MNKTTAIISCLATIAIAAVGLHGYISGEGYMTWLGIRLSSGGFIAVLCAFIVLDFFNLKHAFGANKVAEAIQQEALDRAQAREEALPAMPGEPCQVILLPLPSVSGNSMKVRVFLNGREQGMIKKCMRLEMKTDQIRNELSLIYPETNATSALEFDAVPGGRVVITLDYLLNALAVLDPDIQVPDCDAKGRYRKLSAGMMAWSIFNCLVYFLGLVPLFKTLYAARQPFEADARKRLRSARTWNIVLSSILAFIALCFVVAIKK